MKKTAEFHKTLADAQQLIQDAQWQLRMLMMNDISFPEYQQMNKENDWLTEASERIQTVKARYGLMVGEK